MEMVSAVLVPRCHWPSAQQWQWVGWRARGGGWRNSSRSPTAQQAAPAALWPTDLTLNRDPDQPHHLRCTLTEPTAAVLQTLSRHTHSRHLKSIVHLIQIYSTNIFVVSFSDSILTQLAGQQDSRVQQHLLWYHSWELSVVTKGTLWSINRQRNISRCPCFLISFCVSCTFLQASVSLTFCSSSLTWEPLGSSRSVLGPTAMLNKSCEDNEQSNS